ncbi:MAG: type VI secretion system contractile sheath small subunit [Nannocystis sp.]|jgi:type VI secretion system protein ImpB|nr:type VI secretion system contractile sheath small subunit [Nannocystis sp.]
MANDKQVSVAPKERVNIRYKSATDGAQEDVELPLRILMVGDFTGKEDDRAIEDREPIDINKETFNDVMAAQGLGAEVSVENHLVGSGEMSASLTFKNLGDFRPEGIVEQVPELRELRELRDALKHLKGPLGNVPSFTRQIQALLKDPDKRRRLMEELGLTDQGEGGE